MKPEKLWKIENDFVHECYFVGDPISGSDHVKDMYGIYAKTSGHFPERVHVDSIDNGYTWFSSKIKALETVKKRLERALKHTIERLRETNTKQL